MLSDKKFINKQTLSELPQVPGVYLYYSSKDEVIYVGKAKNLKNRVKSYFSQKLDAGSKTAVLVSNIEKLGYIETFSEFEALLLEAELIKKYKPHYNIILKDDKSYLYIVIRNIKVETHEGIRQVPIIKTARKNDVHSTDLVFGPYPDGTTAKSVIKSLRRVFPYRDCSTSKFSKYKKSNSPCLYGHIGLCNAPCVEGTSLSEYRKNITKIRKTLSGDSKAILTDLERQMKKASNAQKYEEAVKFREALKKFNYVRQHAYDIKTYISNPYLVDDISNKALNELVDAIPGLKEIPNRIECYDVSNLSGKEATASMVVATNAKLDKSEYKRFKIKKKNSPDDFEMMREALTRRLKRDWDFPGLLVVDGGKGQVSAALDVFTALGINLPVIGLAKKFETIVYKENEEFHELTLERSNEGLKLLQRLRDESHRFAKSYHKKLRLKKLLENQISK